MFNENRISPIVEIQGVHLDVRKLAFEVKRDERYPDFILSPDGLFEVIAMMTGKETQADEQEAVLFTLSHFAPLAISVLPNEPGYIVGDLFSEEVI